MSKLNKPIRSMLQSGDAGLQPDGIGGGGRSELPPCEVKDPCARKEYASAIQKKERTDIGLIAVDICVNS